MIIVREGDATNNVWDVLTIHFHRLLGHATEWAQCRLKYYGHYNAGIVYQTIEQQQLPDFKRAQQEVRLTTSN
jgi:hypothetical protein